KSQLIVSSQPLSHSPPPLAPFPAFVGPGTQLCSRIKDDDPRRSSAYPGSLLHVCSHWRQVALASPTLWSHIDIVLSLPSSQKSLSRAKIFLERAGQAPVDIHIIDKHIRPLRPFNGLDDEHSNHDNDPLRDSSDDEHQKVVREDPETPSFIPTIPTHTRVRSIKLLIAPSSSCGPALRQFFTNCVPGTLTKLDSRGSGPTLFTDRRIRLPLFPFLSGAIPLNDKHEDDWLSVTTLHISGGMCLSWSSNAFRGLTDLRLTGETSISGAEFVNILKSSPKLRILKFPVVIIKALPMNARVMPVQLDDLEILDIIYKRLDGASFEAFARWIVLGKNPLRLSLWCSLGAESVKNFFRRVNVTEFHARLDGRGGDVGISELKPIIDLSPGLRVLVIDACDFRFLSMDELSMEDTSVSPTRINTLHLQYCQSIQIDKLRRMIKTFSIHTLTMWSCGINHVYRLPPDRKVFTLCPVVKRLKRREYTPMENWINSIV
ncbi:unnamed protein product, partial [Rhizoctonia solani]